MHPGVEHVARTRDGHQAERNALNVRQADIVFAASTRADTKLLASEQRAWDALKLEQRAVDEEIRLDDERIAELQEEAAREERAATSRAKYSTPGIATGSASATPRGGGVYRPDDTSVSFFKDLRNAKLGDVQAGQRLHDNNTEVRAIGNTGGVGGSGGEFSPPGYLVDQFVALARAGRVMADRCVKDQLPFGVSSINIPKVQTWTSTGVQTTQNTSLASVDPTTSQLTSAITSIGGKNVVSKQLLDQSAIPFDKMILGDLAADYARSLGLQVISGTGTAGQLLGVLTYFTASGTANYTYTQTTPSVSGTGGFYAAINHAISQVATARFLAPNCIVMHPRRWSWVAGSFDGSGRPLVSPSGNAFNQVASAGSVAAQGPVGEMAGLPVYTDPNIPINTGAGTNQDPVFVGKFDDLYLWENGPTMTSFDAPYADSAGVLFRALGYSSFIPSRYVSSVSVISGTGLITPTY